MSPYTQVTGLPYTAASIPKLQNSCKQRLQHPGYRTPTSCISWAYTTPIKCISISRTPLNCIYYTQVYRTPIHCVSLQPGYKTPRSCILNTQGTELP
ncbi:hypothetical protein QR98_0098750 [Sarcoptes scabiei]|uniref:Uncharacterized protein n=1 Tax=Sarcoptes scabiei TaxID=52283 RepID=A0A132AL43_SARSC|nr:hypothetical protein QR98_0098750 [Sarcoptes scabiei]